MQTAEQFWSRVERSDGCWLWMGARLPSGHGQLLWRGKVIGSHRVAWMLDNESDIPDGLWVLHRCDNPPCVRPSHLFLGTHSDNMKDAAAKGRVPHLLNPDRPKFKKGHVMSAEVKQKISEARRRR